ncbi:MAG TPA: carboxypeptidase regulatory-like domain-containing protein, partial [Candidatus Glassbacteria bacterium]|nr:carboxypeptidase regulatory-like domain-containing protein [Candidatus Glassbacteria bacterium]
ASAGRVLLQAGVSATARAFEVSYDENGYTATAGFASSSAAAAVVFTAPWDGTLGKIRLHFNQPEMTISGRVFLGIDGVGAWSDTAARIADTVVASSGWQLLPLDRPVSLTAGDSFAVLVILTGATDYPLSIDHRGPVSGRSQAAGSLAGNWEVLGYDLNLRAVLESAIPALFPVSGRVFAAGAPLAGALVTLQSASASYRAHSGADGAFAVPVVAGGNYELNTEYTGYRFRPLALTVDRALEGISVRGRKEGAGDVDGSGRVDVFDLIELLAIINGR